MQVAWERFRLYLAVFAVLATGVVAGFAAPDDMQPSANDASDSTRSDSKKGDSARRDYVDRLTGKFRLERGDSSLRAPVRSEKSILSWSWNRNGFTDGQTYVWSCKGRPLAIGGAFLIPTEQVAYYEFVSISPEPLVCKLGDKPVWTPPAVDLAWWKVPSAPEPAATTRGRLVQLSSVSRQIGGVAKMGPPRYEVGSRWELRLLTTPLYRYADAEREVLDGAMFVMVMGTDPQLLVFVEAQQGEGKAEWRVAFAPLSGFELAASFGDKEIWHAEAAKDGHAKGSVWHLSHPVDATPLFAAEPK